MEVVLKPLPPIFEIDYTVRYRCKTESVLLCDNSIGEPETLVDKSQVPTPPPVLADAEERDDPK